MTRKIVGFFIALAFATLGAASAQYVPQGSYLQSCTNVRMGGRQLFAVCPSPNGRRSASTIDPNACAGADIANINGVLRCNGGNAVPGYGNGLPNGSYQASCINASIRGAVLSAACTTPNGQRERSQLDVNRCAGADIQNADGVLACGAGNPYTGNAPLAGALPPGSYQQSCTNASTNYGRLSATCPTSSGLRINTSVNLGRCRPGTDIANINGHLECMNYR